MLPQEPGRGQPLHSVLQLLPAAKVCGGLALHDSANVISACSDQSTPSQRIRVDHQASPHQAPRLVGTAADVRRYEVGGALP